MRLVSNYQKMLDHRLSKPKETQKVKAEVNANKDERVYRNSALKDQKRHQSVFSSKKLSLARPEQQSRWDLEDEFRNTFDERTLAHLKNLFSSNFRAFNNSERPQKNVYITQSKY